MTDSTPEQPISPQPSPPPKKRSGCRTALIVFGIVVIIAIVVGYFTCPKLLKVAMDKSISTLKDNVVENLPEGYDGSEIEENFNAIAEAFREGKLKGREAGLAVRETAEIVTNAIEDGTITLDEAEDISKALKSLRDMVSKE